MVEYTSSADGPKAFAVLEAVQDALLADPSLDAHFKSLLQDYIRSLRDTPMTSTEVPMPPTEVLRYDQLENQVKVILQEHEEKSDFLRRFKRPTGSEAARAGNLLFYPPASNKDSNRDTLVRGPDTTFRMLEAHLSDVGLFTMDLYPFSTTIPITSPGCRAFKFDTTFSHSDTAVKLWDLFYAHAAQVYAERAIKPGVEIVWGEQARTAYKSTTASVKLGSQWRWLASSGLVSIPAISNDFGTFEAGSHEFEFKLCYRKVLDNYEFGKLAIFHCHPSRPGVIASKGLPSNVGLWRQAVMTDTLVKLLYFVSRGQESPAVPEQHTFAQVAIPFPSFGRARNVNLSGLRSDEKKTGKIMTRKDLDALDPNIMLHIQKYTPDLVEDGEKSVLFQACSAVSKRSQANRTAEERSQAAIRANITKGPEVRKAAAQKRIAKMGPAGCKAATIKGDKTKGPEIMRMAGIKSAATKGMAVLRAAGYKAAATKGPAARYAAAVKAVKTKGIEGLRAAGLKGANTKGAEARKAAAVKAIKTKGIEGLRAAGLKAANTKGAEARKAAAVKAIKTKGIEGLRAAGLKAANTKGIEGSRAAGLKGVQTRLAKGVDFKAQGVQNFAKLKADKEKFTAYVAERRQNSNRAGTALVSEVMKEEWKAHVDAYRKEQIEKTGKDPRNQWAKQNCIRSLRAALFKQNDQKQPTKLLESHFNNWPEGLPVNVNVLNANEMDSIGALLLAGKIELVPLKSEEDANMEE